MLVFNLSLQDIHPGTQKTSKFMKERGNLYKETEPGTYRGHIQDTFNVAQSKNFVSCSMKQLFEDFIASTKFTQINTDKRLERIT